MIKYGYLNGDKNVELLHSLLQKTKGDMVSWVELLEIQRYLENDGILMSKIRWLHMYLRHLQAARFMALHSSTYVAIFEGKLVMLARSKYSGQLRLDWMVINSRTMGWRKCEVSNLALIKLQQVIESVGVSDSRSDIEDILYSTDRICV